MTFVNGNAVVKCSFSISQFKGTSHGNQSGYLVSVIISNILIISLSLILLSGDIESNPGPLGSEIIGTLSTNKNISEKFKYALSRLDLPWLEIKSKLSVSNWRDSISLWGSLSKLIFKRNRLALRKKVMLFWYNNIVGSIKDKVNPIHDSHEIIDKGLKLIVSIDLSKLAANQTFQIHKMAEFSNLQDGFYKLQPTPVTLVNETETPSLESSYSDDLDACTVTNDVSYQYHISKIDGSWTHKPKQTNNFFLTPQEWESIKPNVGWGKLLPNWTYTFDQKLSNLYPYCVLKFLYHRINIRSESRNCPFIFAQAICKFNECLRFSIWIDKIPKGRFDYVCVKVSVEGYLSSEHFDHSTAHSRNISGEHREELGKKVTYSSALNYHYDLFNNSHSLDVAKHGNLNELHSQEVLRKVKSQYLRNHRFSDDMWQDVIITKKTYDSTIKGKVLDGYIQMMSRYPLVIHMYSEEQLLFLKLIDKSKLKLHLDATGSVVRKLDRDQKNFLYYALTLQHPQAKLCPIPVAEMLTSEQTNVEITHFLNRWCYDVRRILNRDICPSQVEVDFSWAMLHSICKIFNKQHLEDYLNTCWQYIHTSQHFNSVLIKCQERIDNFKIQHKDDDGYFLEDNDNFFLPQLPNFLVTHYMPICPLWTSLILGPVMVPNGSDVRCSNAVAENWMRILKINILQNQTKLRPGDFLRKIRQGLNGRVRAFDFAFEPMSSKIMKTNKTSRKSNHNKLAEENWKRRKESKTKYFMTTNFQIPETRNNCYSTEKAHDVPKSESKVFGTKRNIIHRKDKKSITLRKGRPLLREIHNPVPAISSCMDDELSSDESILLTNKMQEVSYYNNGQFSPVNQLWQKEKCKFLQLTYVCGVLYGNESSDKSLQIRELTPSKEKRISPDGNCLFRSISYVITGAITIIKKFEKYWLKI